MHLLERILLYAVSLTSIALVFRSEPPHADQTSEQSPTLSGDAQFMDDLLPLPEDITLGTEKSDSIPLAGPKPNGQAAENPATTPRSQSQNGFVLKDRRGQPRIEIKIGPDDEPQDFAQ